MPRDFKLYLNDMLSAIEKIDTYMENIKDYLDFLENELVFDAVIKNLMIIGEAVKKLPSELTLKYSNIEWRNISGFRDVLIHSYFKINPAIVYDVIKNKLPSLKETINLMINNENF
ncbi:MAG: DUF86 domain-containing protein [Methanococcus maripaludis]|uniref:DUF86 domain-containing protein n=3 Tax=Methanococcus maripaludis TaxID=39152 RepID=A0A8T3W4U6_METMI|nr:hypothetical protein GYY_04505 [Methanococcus maripaludis X1]MBG0768350.1 DUF86 domain-containing protein [Methanococcus maripaludis]